MDDSRYPHLNSAIKQFVLGPFDLFGIIITMGIISDDPRGEYFPFIASSLTKSITISCVDFLVLNSQEFYVLSEQFKKIARKMGKKSRE